MSIAPAGFTQDDSNPELFWGEQITADKFFLALVWNAEEGVQLHVEVNGTLRLEEATSLRDDLALFADKAKALG